MLIAKRKKSTEERLAALSSRPGRNSSVVMFCAVSLLALSTLVLGCSPQGTAQQAAATATPSAGSAVSTPTPAPAATGTAQAATPSAPTSPTVRPTPSGPAPTPESVLNVFTIISPGTILVKRDSMQLNNDSTNEILFTITTPGTITQEAESAIAVLLYDPIYREWNVDWQSAPAEVKGLASPMLAVNPVLSRVGGYNGGDLVRAGAPIFMVRTTTLDGRAHLYMWKWDAARQQGVHLRMVPVGGGSERDAIFDADVDVKIADLDNDGVYEVIAENLNGTLIWKWDGSKYAPEAKR